MSENQTKPRRHIVPRPVISRLYCGFGSCHTYREDVPRAEAVELGKKGGWRCPKHEVNPAAAHEASHASIKDHPSYRPADQRPEIGSTIEVKGINHVIVSAGAIGVKVRRPKGKKVTQVEYSKLDLDPVF